MASMNLYDLMNIETHWASPDNPNRAEILRQGAFRAGARAYREFKRGTPGYCYHTQETDAWQAGWKAEAEKDTAPSE